MRNQKYIVMSFLSAGVLVGFSLQGLLVPLLARAEVSDPMLLGMINGSTLFGLLAGVFTFLVLNRHPSVVRFTDEVVSELRRVTWPDREETLHSTTVVLGTTLFVAGCLFVYDQVWRTLAQAVLFSEG